MSCEIVRKLMTSHKKLEFLDEDRLYEVDDEDPDDEDDTEEEHDDSMAPEQGSPDDDNDDDDPDDNFPSSVPKSISHNSSSSSPQEEDVDDTIDDLPDEEIPDDIESTNDDTYKNPLDNEYAVGFKLGSEVSLSHKGESKEELAGVIEGYDTEGFYRVKWKDGTITNGLTDISLDDLVKKKSTIQESRCICGSRKYVREGNCTVCDICGRRLREDMDQLTLADKKRPAGKRMIRSVAHPISTAINPSIEGTINESEKDEIGDLEDKLGNKFWTRKEEMKSDIEDLGFNIAELNGDYIVISSEKNEEDVYRIPLGGTSRSITLDFDKVKIL